MSTALALFRQLVAVGNALECLRNAHAPASETWLALTCLVQALDEAIDTLVRSNGLGGDDDAA